ncbi:hypothetical protein ACFWYW_41800 [Nonomuraea sp. NPDC059023]|uniref:hypothetical protein n=1 Tax=unclassified Nonomuraea TaxID=2593643 RepID=UPI0036ADC4AE
MRHSLIDQDVLPRHSRVVIVGGGLAGLEVARHLEARQVDDVLVLEAGPGDELRHVNQVHDGDRALRQWLLPETDPYYVRPWAALNAPHFTGTSGLRRRVGGRSLYWYGVVLPAESWALTPTWWPVTVASDLRDSWHGGPSLYDRTLDQLASWCGGELPGGDPVPPLRDLRLETAPLAVRHDPDHPGRWHAYSPLDTWRDPRTGEPRGGRGGVRVRARAEVVRVVIRDGRARGVLVREGGGGVREVQAGAVVLSAGAVCNAGLALRALSDVRGGPVRRLPSLYDHLVQGFLVRLEGAGAARLLHTLPPGSYYAPCAPSARSNLFVHVTAPSAGGAVVDAQLTGEQLPSPGTWIEQRAGLPVAVYSCLSAEDATMLDGQREILQSVWEQIAGHAGAAPTALAFRPFADPASAGAAAVLPQSLDARPAADPLTWSGYIGTEDHEGGGTPLGGMLTDRHEFAEIDGLYAAGPGTFPRMGAANPSLTTLALARRLAAILAGTEA